MISTSQIKENSASQISSGKTLENGSLTRVRIIKDNGNGSYEGSVAGIKISLNSKQKLAEGSTFVAKAVFTDGKLTLVVDNSVSELSAENAKLLNTPQVLQLLESLNLPAEQVSLTLLQEMKQLEMKLDPQVLNKLLNMSIKVKGKEKKAAELLVLLSKKGVLDLTDANEVLTLLEVLERDEHSGEDMELLSKINKRAGDWLIFPFNIQTVDDEEVVAKGNIKVLLSNDGVLKLLKLDCNYGEHEYYFCGRYENRRLKEVFYNDNYNPPEIIEELKKRFFGKDIFCKVEWKDKSDLEGFASALEELYMVNASV